MAKVNKAPEYRLEHRLTGAVILVVLAVLVIPLLLKEPGLEANTQETIAETEDGKKTFKSKIEPLTLSNVNNSSVVSALDQSDDVASLSVTEESVAPSIIIRETMT